jgi:hypothetical protein
MKFCISLFLSSTSETAHLFHQEANDDENKYIVSFLDFRKRYVDKRTMFESSNSTSLIFFDIPTISTPLSAFDNLSILISDQFITKQTNLTCNQIKYEYVSQKPLFNIVRYITHNLNRFFILPAIILNLCAFYILRRTRMNRSSSIAFYMQTLALCDVAFFALRVLFGELSSLSANKHILTTGLCKFLFLMVNAVNYTTGE